VKKNKIQKEEEEEEKEVRLEETAIYMYVKANSISQMCSSKDPKEYSGPVVAARRICCQIININRSHRDPWSHGIRVTT